MLKKWIVASVAALASAPVAAQSFPGPIIAEFYMTEFSIPKGWTLSYKGVDGGAQVFIMDRDLDTYPQTSFLQPIDQLRRVMCGDAELQAMVNSGTAVRVDARDKVDGTTTTTKGPVLSRC